MPMRLMLSLNQPHHGHCPVQLLLSTKLPSMARPAVRGGALTLNASTAGTISNSILQGGVVTLGGLANTLTNDTVTVLTGATGVLANTATTITNCTFSVAGIGMGTQNARRY